MLLHVIEKVLITILMMTCDLVDCVQIANIVICCLQVANIVVVILEKYYEVS